VQNWTATNNPDEATLKSAVVGKNTLSQLAATGDGIVAYGEAQNIRLSWDNVNAVPGTELMGAVGIGTSRETPNNIGIIPVSFTKAGVADSKTLVLMNGFSRSLTLNAGGTHDRAFIDVPPGTDSLSITVSGADSTQSENLGVELYRVDFDDAFTDAPLVAAANTSGNPLASASGANGNGPSLTVSGGDLVPGRWYVVLKNNNGSDSALEVKADLGFVGSPAPMQFGLWEPSSRDKTHSGIDFNSTGDYRAMLWYTYNEDGSPTWYQAAAVAPDGNVFTARIYRYTNDGALQHSTPVGHVSVTTLGENDLIFSFVLFGENGSDRMFSLTSPSCPTVDGSKKSYDGLWSKTEIGLGGASGFANETSQAFVHYIYDDSGSPVWLTAAAADEATEMSFLQWTGYCVVCTGSEPTHETAGVFSRDFADEYNLTWTLDYVLNSSLSGSIKRTDITEKLTVDQVCE